MPAAEPPESDSRDQRDPPRVHSEDYFGDTRDLWWNKDYLELLAKRWDASGVRHVLDVGCGFGHWSRALAEVLPSEARFVALDPEAESLKEAERRNSGTPLGARSAYRLGRVEALPFHDDGFDLVTCQTVLIHVADPARALAEMVRVLKPGGRLVVVEPDNLAGCFALESRFTGAADEVLAALFRLQMVCERGKRNLGEGDNSIGARLPELFRELSLSHVQAYQGDRLNVLAPPYTAPYSRAERADLERLTAAGHFVWRRQDTERYFLAGGGDAGDFERLWGMARSERLAVMKRIGEGTWWSVGGHVTVVMSGTKASST